jgi:hypothetical protein
VSRHFPFAHAGYKQGLSFFGNDEGSQAAGPALDVCVLVAALELDGAAAADELASGTLPAAAHPAKYRPHAKSTS